MSVAAAISAAERVAADACGGTIFLDFQATTPLDPRVLEAMLPWMEGAHNAHAVEHRPGRAAARAVEDARERVAVLLGCRPSEITFTSGATEASNIALRGLTAAGDALAISAIEHASVMATADALEAEGRSASRIRVSDDGVLDLDALEEALTAPTRLVSIMAVNNEVGTVQPLEEAAGLCAERGVPFHSDVTQAVGRIPVRLGGSPVAYASMSAHKIYGPQGVGALFVGEGAPRPRPLAAGGAQENGLRPGTLPVAGCVGLRGRVRAGGRATPTRLRTRDGLAADDAGGSLEPRRLAGERFARRPRTPQPEHRVRGRGRRDPAGVPARTRAGDGVRLQRRGSEGVRDPEGHRPAAQPRGGHGAHRLRTHDHRRRGGNGRRPDP